MADDPNTSAIGDPISLAAQFISLWPRLALATSKMNCRQLREATGVDYSLIDYRARCTMRAASRERM